VLGRRHHGEFGRDKSRRLSGAGMSIAGLGQKNVTTISLQPV
jgi:hypothetical protein